MRAYCCACGCVTPFIGSVCRECGTDEDTNEANLYDYNVVEVEWSRLSGGETTTGETQALWTVESLKKVVDAEYGTFDDWVVTPVLRTYDDGVRTVSIMFERGYAHMLFTVKR